MGSVRKISLILEVLVFVLFHEVLRMARATIHRHDFVVVESNYTRLCETKTMLTVNGKFPGPIILVRRGDRLKLNVINKAKDNITIHWHGVKQPRNPWSDGPEYITQCPIQPGANFTQELIFSNEEGTLWWHAHSDWSRATVHGAIVIYPKKGATYPFPQPNREIPIILGSWFKGSVMEVLDEALKTGGAPNQSDSYTINGQPGYLYPCSKPDTFRMTVEFGKSYLLRIINAAMNTELFFAVAQHNLTLVGTDGSYTKPLTTSYIMITPGQTMDVLLTANQTPSHYFMAARTFSSSNENKNTTAILQYSGNYTPPPSPSFPNLPAVEQRDAAFNFTSGLRSLADKDHPIDVPKTIKTRIIITISLNQLPCNVNNSCEGPNGGRFSASMNNRSFVTPSIDILEAYYRKINGVYSTTFPDRPPFEFNFTGDKLSGSLLLPTLATDVKVLDYNSTVEIVLQGTNLFGGANHPIHLHGYNFYLVGKGVGNFNETKDPLGYNLIDPPDVNTIGVPQNGWAAFRFRADNPGVWFMHCHLERHVTWGMSTVFIVKNGRGQNQKILPRPRDMPPC